MSDLPTTNDLDAPFLPIHRWAAATRASTGKARRSLNDGTISAVKNGKSTLIRQTPREYLESLPAYQPGSMPAGPGRGHRRPKARGTSV